MTIGTQQNSASDATLEGGIMIWGESDSQKIAIALTNENDSVVVELELGDWTFWAAAWDGHNSQKLTVPLSGGETHCGTTVQTLAASEETVSLSLNDTNCNSAVFTDPTFMDGARFSGLYLNDCTSFDDPNGDAIQAGTENCDYPLDRIGHARSFKFVLRTYDPNTDTAADGLVSACYSKSGITSTLDIFNSNPDSVIRLPLGGSGPQIATVIRAYDSFDCSIDSANGDDFVNYTFPNGLNGGGTGFDVIKLGPLGNNLFSLYYAATESGSAYSPFSSVLPLIECAASAPCVGLAPTQDYKFHQDHSATHQIEIESCSTCAVTETSTAGNLDLLTCQINGSGKCEINLSHTAGYSSATGDDFSFDLTIDSASSPLNKTVIITDGILEDAQRALWDIQGSPDGKNYIAVTNNSGNSGKKNIFSGELGSIRELLGPNVIGGYMYKSGIATCVDARDNPGTTSVQEDDDTYTVKWGPSTTIIPNYIYDDIADINSASDPFTVRIEAYKNGGATPILAVDFNCPGEPGGNFVGQFIEDDIFEQSAGGDRDVHREVFWNADPADNDSRFEITTAEYEVSGSDTRHGIILVEKASATTANGYYLMSDYDGTNYRRTKASAFFNNASNSLFSIESAGDNDATWITNTNANFPDAGSFTGSNNFHFCTTRYSSGASSYAESTAACPSIAAPDGGPTAGSAISQFNIDYVGEPTGSACGTPNVPCMENNFTTLSAEL